MDDNTEIEEEKREIEVVTDDDSELDISNVYDHLNFEKVRETPERKDIIIPGVKKDDSNSDGENSSTEDEDLSSETEISNSKSDN